MYTEYNELDKKIKDLRKQANIIYKQLWTLEERQKEIKKKIYLEDGYLNDYIWILKIDDNYGTISLDAINYPDEKCKGKKNLEFIFNSEYHDYVELEPKLSIALDDGRIYIYGDNNNILLSFIEKYNLNINVEDLEKTIKKTKNEFSETKKALKKLKDLQIQLNNK